MVTGASLSPLKAESLGVSTLTTVGGAVGAPCVGAGDGIEGIVPAVPPFPNPPVRMDMTRRMPKTIVPVFHAVFSVNSSLTVFPRDGSFFKASCSMCELMVSKPLFVGVMMREKRGNLFNMPCWQTNPLAYLYSLKKA